MRTAAVVVGILLTLWTVFTIVQAMLIPRQAQGLIGRSVSAIVDTASHAPLRMLRAYPAQDRWLAGAGPVAVLLQLVVYVVILTITMGMVFFGTMDLSITQAVYQAGATLTTLGIVQPVDFPSGVAAFVTAFLGLVVIAIFIGYLMALYGAYVNRETQMARLSMVAGEPAWGPQVLVRHRALHLPDDTLPDAKEWIDWTCSVRLSQQVNPILAAFRSTSQARHWVVSLLAVMDAATLRMSFSGQQPDPEHVMLITEGALTLRVMATTRFARGEPVHNWVLEQAVLRAEPTGHDPDPGLSRAEWDEAVDYLVRSGVALNADRDAAWRRFSAIRSCYATDAYAIAKARHAVPAPWSGPRDPAVPTMWPQLAEAGD